MKSEICLRCGLYERDLLLTDKSGLFRLKLRMRGVKAQIEDLERLLELRSFIAWKVIKREFGERARDMLRYLIDHLQEPWSGLHEYALFLLRELRLYRLAVLLSLENIERLVINDKLRFHEIALDVYTALLSLMSSRNLQHEALLFVCPGCRVCNIGFLQVEDLRRLARKGFIIASVVFLNEILRCSVVDEVINAVSHEP